MVNEDVAALMITNPSTLGIYEQNLPEIAQILHAKGVLLYMDGANMNALAGITRPGDLGVEDRKSTRLNSSHGYISYAVFCLKKTQRSLPMHLRPARWKRYRTRSRPGRL